MKRFTWRRAQPASETTEKARAVLNEPAGEGPIRALYANGYTEEEIWPKLFGISLEEVQAVTAKLTAVTRKLHESNRGSGLHLELERSEEGRA